MKCSATLDGELDEVICISACNLMQAGLNAPSDVERMGPLLPINKNGTASAAVVVIDREICLAVRGAN